MTDSEGQRRGLVASNLSYAGLGNRMRFTLSALSLAEAHGREFCFAWPQTDAFRPPLSRLWNFREVEIDSGSADRLAQTHPYAARVEDLGESPHELPLWIFRSGNALTVPPGAPTWSDRFRALDPTAEIEDRVRLLHRAHFAGDAYVGVSIRASAKSHAKTLEHSPIAWYKRRMSQILADTPGVKFFISCDVPEVQDELIRLFPTSIGQTNKGGYNSSEGVVASVVDLYLLAASNYMLVPYWSSFPHMAWELAGRKIAMEHSVAGGSSELPTNVANVIDPLKPTIR